MAKKLTPMLEQYYKVKEQHKDALLFFRLGDFYELFEQDALDAHKILGITLTARHKGTESEIAMSGVPYHSAEGYISKLIRAGQKIAICEQVSDPSEPGIVQRKVVRIITPGTVLQESILTEQNNNYLLSLAQGKDGYGIAYCDLSTGEMKATQIQNFQNVLEEISSLNPAEIILDSKSIRFEDISHICPNISTYQNPEDPETTIKSQFNIQNVQVFGLDRLPLSLQATANLVAYLQETQKTELSHIYKIQSYHVTDYMLLDEQSLRNLEILESGVEGRKEGSLLWVIDHTETSMGARLLRQMLIKPLIDKDRILLRQELVQSLHSQSSTLSKLRQHLSECYDIQRLIGRIASRRGNARDIQFLGKSLIRAQRVSNELSYIELAQNSLLQDIKAGFDASVFALGEHIQTILKDELPQTIQEGDLFADNYDQKLDEMRHIIREGQTWLNEHLQSQQEASDIAGLKIKYNDNFGYYLKVTHANKDKVLDNWTLKQTLVSELRYTTPELSDFEKRYREASHNICLHEYELFKQLQEYVAGFVDAIQKGAESLAMIDVLANFASITDRNDYCFPEIHDDTTLDIHKLRHPVLEKLEPYFVENDAHLSQKERLALITGPNMGGKSTYLRSLGLCVLLGQIGASVPASKAHIGVCDRIFTRVGAQDNLNRGQSTFMVEMQEMALILNHATEKSLVLLDEVGRGTSVYDGLALARAIVEYLHDTLKPKVLFATHYHELAEYVQSLPSGKNLRIAISNENGEIVFLHKIVEGSASKSYGISVADQAGIPKPVLYEAQKYLEFLESKTGNSANLFQNTLFNAPQSGDTSKQKELEQKVAEYENYKQTLQAYKDIDPNSMTPIDALQKLSEIIKRL